MPGWRLGEGLATLALPILRAGFAGACSPRRRRRSRMSGGAVAGPDGLLRCPWALSAPEYLDYHDHEWGRPVRTVQGLYERLTLEAFQSGPVLDHHPAQAGELPQAFAGFDPEPVAGFDEADVERLMGDAGIVRNRAKIEAAINNARVVASSGRTSPGSSFAIRSSIGRRRPPRTGVRPRRSRWPWPRS